jgi:hypothetical protein
MPRPQTSLNLPYDPTITPAAQPTDQFHAPIVSSPDTASAHELAALGEALSKLEPTITSIGDQQFKAYQGNSVLQASRDRAEMRLESMQKLRDAVKAGKIQEAQNPWYMAQMEEEVGRVAANQNVAKAWMEYEQTPDVRKSNDVNVVSKFFADRFGQSVQADAAGSVWAAGAMSKVYQDAQQQLVQRHVQNRAREIPEEREVAAKADIGDALAGVTSAVRSAAQAGDPAAIATMTHAKSALQTKLNELLLTIDPITANKWVKESIVDHALSVEDADVARELMGSLTTKDGKGLILNDQDRTLMHHLYDRVADLKLHRVQLEEEYERKLDKEQTKQVTGSILSAMADAKSKGVDFDFGTALTPEQLKTLPPTVVQAVTQAMSQQLAFGQQVENVKDENKRHDILKTGASNFVLGKMTPDQQVTFTDLLLTAGGHHDFATLVQTKRQLSDMQYPDESDPATMGALVTAIGNGDMAGREGIDRLVDVVKTGKVSARDFREFSFLLLGRMNRGDTSFDREVLAAGQGAVTDLIRDKRVDQVGIDRRGELATDTVFLGQVNKARNEYLFAHEAMTQDAKWASLPPAEKQQQTQSLIDSIAQKYGGYTSAQGEAAASKRVAQEEKDRADAERKAAAKKAGTDITIDSDIKAVTDQGDPALKNMDSSVHQALKAAGISAADIAPSPNKNGFWIFGANSPKYSTPELTALVDIQRHSLSDRSLGAAEVIGEPAQQYVDAAIQKLQTSRDQALIAAQSLGKTIQDDNFAGRIKKTSDDIAKNGFATPQQKAVLTYLWTKTREYALLRQRAGYTVDEVKDSGQGRLPEGSPVRNAA